MRYDTIIRGGTLVTVGGQVKSDLAISGEKIAAIGQDLAKGQTNGARIVDARGRYVMPGGVDVHVHLELPFCGTVSSDDYDSGTKAAARGGVTTVIDFAIPYGDETLQQGIDNWHARAEGKACVDYSFHSAITDWKRHAKELPKIMDQGITTFKEFMIYEKEGWQSDDAAIFGALEALRDLGGMLLIHAESSRVLDLLIERHHNKAEMKKHGAYLHTITRPNYIEAEAIQRAIRWAEVTGGTLFIVHMSTAQGTDLVKRARGRGVKVFAETCVQYLTLDDSVFAGKDGHLYATCPQLKKKSDQMRLWQGLRDGEVCGISTDTCSFTRKQKAMWKGDWTKIPMGLPGLETLLPAAYTDGVLKRRITLEQFVQKVSTEPARMMGLYPSKGSLDVGTDADLAIIHPKKRLTVDWHKMESNTDWNPYQGRALAGFAEATFCRGKQIVENYKFTGTNGYGKFLRRSTPANV
ncbi:MAG: dihydropyrimidinase [Planctomycetes bacterium]|nr:dihydropyrimidinase [Planctomycetota bacterium]